LPGESHYLASSGKELMGAVHSLKEAVRGTCVYPC